MGYHLRSIFSVGMLLMLLTMSHAMNGHFLERQFEKSVQKALQQVEGILNHTRDMPRLAHLEKNHTYQDKYELANVLTNTAVAAIWQTLELIEFQPQQAMDWVQKEGQSVQMGCEIKRTCSLSKELEVEIVESETEKSTETCKNEGDKAKCRTSKDTVRTKVVQKAKEYHWKIDQSYQIYVCPRNNCHDQEHVVQLRDGHLASTIVTSSKNPPVTNSSELEWIDLTWLLNITASHEGESVFSIDRTRETCKTPRRNEDVEAAMQFFQRFHRWCTRILNLDGGWFKTSWSDHDRTDMASSVDGTVRDLFHPVLPLMESNATVISSETVALLLEEHKRSLRHALSRLSDLFPSDKDGEVSIKEATIYLVLKSISAIMDQYIRGVTYLEDMLESQLYQAIGKQVQPDDFDQFMRFHNQKLFGPNFVPTPFSYAVRQPNQYPVGVLSIERLQDDMAENNDLAETMTKHMGSGFPIYIPIDAATKVEMTGDVYLSGWIQQQFESMQGPKYALAARARQFSSFLLLVGTMMGPDSFSPKHAIIVQNKDEVLIPLLAETIPSAREFQDAIVSLSPEQQAFAKAFRRMQLESSVLGVCVIQLRPQLEKLLSLPNGALTKEIKLTQDLMSLFIDYQIPSDLLSYDGKQDSVVANKVDVVRGYVKAVMDVIHETKEKQLAEEQQKAKVAKARAEGVDHSLRHARILAQSDFVEASTSNSLRGAFALHADHVAEEIALEPDVSEPPKSFDDTVSPDLRSDRDFTLLPKLLDEKLQEHDAEGYLRSTTIKVGSIWTRKRQDNLLTPMMSSVLDASELDVERKKAFDLLDAISRSGTLPLDFSELHVIVAATHCFEKSLVATLVEDNINPIEKVEKSALLLASTIYGEPESALIGDAEAQKRLSASFPTLFGAIAADPNEESEVKKT